MITDFKYYSETQVHFVDDVPLLLKDIFYNKKDFSLIDLGCGDGRILFSLEQKKLLDNAKDIVGIDLSPVRIKRLRENVRNSIGLVADVCDTKIKNKFDFIICTQVIEHVPDDLKLIKEIIRLSKKESLIYISSVIKKPYGIYIHRHNGSFRLDPTHLREYPSKEYFIDLLNKNGLRVIESNLEMIKYPVFDLTVRFLIRINVLKISNVPKMNNNPIMRLLRIIKVPIIGYYGINILAKVNSYY